MCYALSMEKTILVVTDIHYISPAIHHFNDAFLYQMANEDGKMTILSDEIMEALVCYVTERKPDVFVITGDLSWNGDMTSHQEIRNYLLRIQKAGIEVYVIPGNHDIGKERARYYAPFCSVLPECADKNDFADIYAPFMIKDDAESFSYVKEIDNIRMFCILAVPSKPKNTAVAIATRASRAKKVIQNVFIELCLTIIHLTDRKCACR